MEANQFLFDILAFVQNIFALLVGVVAVELLAFLLLARTMEQSGQPENVGRAIFGYTMLLVSVLLMALSAVPSLIAVFGGAGFTAEVYFSLVLVFATGGILFLWHDYRLRELPAEARRVPATIYHFTVKSMGQLSLVLSVLYLTLAIALDSTATAGWWSMPLTILLFGLFLIFMTLDMPRKAAKAAAAKPAPIRRKK